MAQPVDWLRYNDVVKASPTEVDDLWMRVSDKVPNLHPGGYGDFVWKASDSPRVAVQRYLLFMLKCGLPAWPGEAFEQNDARAKQLEWYPFASACDHYLGERSVYESMAYAMFFQGRGQILDMRYHPDRLEDEVPILFQCVTGLRADPLLISGSTIYGRAHALPLFQAHYRDGKHASASLIKSYGAPLPSVKPRAPPTKRPMIGDNGKNAVEPPGMFDALYDVNVGSAPVAQIVALHTSFCDCTGISDSSSSSDVTRMRMHLQDKVDQLLWSTRLSQLVASGQFPDYRQWIKVHYTKRQLVERVTHRKSSLPLVHWENVADTMLNGLIKGPFPDYNTTDWLPQAKWWALACCWETSPVVKLATPIEERTVWDKDELDLSAIPPLLVPKKPLPPAELSPMDSIKQMLEEVLYRMNVLEWKVIALEKKSGSVALSPTTSADKTSDSVKKD